MPKDISSYDRDTGLVNHYKHIAQSYELIYRPTFATIVGDPTRQSVCDGPTPLVGGALNFFGAAT